MLSERRSISSAIAAESAEFAECRATIALLVRKGKHVAVVRFPGVFARILDRRGVAVPHVRQRSQQIRFTAQGHLVLVFHHLKHQRGIARILFDLMLHLHLRASPHHQQRRAG